MSACLGAITTYMFQLSSADGEHSDAVENHPLLPRPVAKTVCDVRAERDILISIISASSRRSISSFVLIKARRSGSYFECATISLRPTVLRIPCITLTPKYRNGL